MDNVTVGDKTLISVSRAKEISGYTADYIGQLCRLGSISCKRVSGQWYIDEESLRGRGVTQISGETEGESKHASTSISAYMKTIGTVRDDSLTCDGAQYVSSARAASLTGYAQDYVGELARKGEVEARKMGRQWFVEKKSLLAHKEEKDALLAAVQSDAAGVTTVSKEDELNNDAVPFRVTYTTEMPRTLFGTPAVSRKDAGGKVESAETQPIPVSITDHDMLPDVKKSTSEVALPSIKTVPVASIPQSRISEIRLKRTENDVLNRKEQRPFKQPKKKRWMRKVFGYTFALVVLTAVAYGVSISVPYIIRQGVAMPNLPNIDITAAQDFIDQYGSFIPGRTVEYTK